MKHDQMLGVAIVNVSRRTVLTGIAAGSFILATGLPVLAEEVKYAGDGMPHGLREDPKVASVMAYMLPTFPT